MAKEAKAQSLETTTGTQTAIGGAEMKMGLDPVPVIDNPPDDTIKPGDQTWTDDTTET